MIRPGTLAARAVAFAILALLCVGIWVGPVAIYLEAREASGARVARAEALVARQRALATAPAEVSGRGPSAELLLEDLPTVQVFAALSDRIKAAAAAAGVSLQGLQSLAEDSALGMTRAGIRLRGSADLPALARFLDAVEGGRPFLRVDGLRLQSRQATGAADDLPLDIQLDVFGFKGAT